METFHLELLITWPSTYLLTLPCRLLRAAGTHLSLCVFLNASPLKRHPHSMKKKKKKSVTDLETFFTSTTHHWADVCYFHMSEVWREKKAIGLDASFFSVAAAATERCVL